MFPSRIVNFSHRQTVYSCDFSMQWLFRKVKTLVGLRVYARIHLFFSWRIRIDECPVVSHFHWYLASYFFFMLLQFFPEKFTGSKECCKFPSFPIQYVFGLVITRKDIFYEKSSKYLSNISKTSFYNALHKEVFSLTFMNFGFRICQHEALDNMNEGMN